MFDLKKAWWKILGVLLLLYGLIFGMLMPLKPGIFLVSPDHAKAGTSTTISVQGYNTNFDLEQDMIRVWLKMDQQYALMASQINVDDAINLKAVFDIPSQLPTERKIQNFTLILDHPVDGACVSPSAVTVTQAEGSSAGKAGSMWTVNPIADLHIIKKFNFPFRNILYETIRNVYFHVSLWLAMMILFIASVVMSFKHLSKGRPEDDWKSLSLTAAGTLFGMLGLITGMIWAQYTWGTFWPKNEVKLNMTAIALLIYLAYFVLRGSVDNPEKRGRIASVYNIFAFAALIPLIFVVPRLTSSLHPGNGGNPALGSDDLDNTMRAVFYPVVIGWTLLGVWMGSIMYRAIALKDKILSR